MFSFWKDGNLVLHKTSLGQSLILLKNNYGLKVEQIDNKILDEEFSRAISVQGISALIEDIDRIFQVKIAQKNDCLWIQKLKSDK